MITTRRMVARIAVVLAVLLAVMGTAASPQVGRVHAATPITSGDLIVSRYEPVNSLSPVPFVEEWTPAGKFVQTLMDSSNGLGLAAGSAFDGNGNLYVTDFSNNQILKREATTGAVTIFSNNTILGDGHVYNSPETIAFSSDFSKLYVSGANRFGPGGGINVVDTATGHGVGFLLLPSSSGSESIYSQGQGESDWLAFNAANALYMTNENPTTQGVMQVNLITGDIVQPSFAPNLPDDGYAISFDKNGDLWVGDTGQILEYSSSGTLLQTITNPNFSKVFAAVFNPAGDQFYAGDLDNGNVYTYNLDGTLTGTFNVSSGNVSSGVSGLSVTGAPLANQPPPSSDQPITATGTTFSATEGQQYSGTVATFTDPITTATTSDYAASIDWGDGSPSSPGTISGSGGNFTVSGAHTYAEEETSTVTVTIAGVTNASNTATATSTANVSDAALTASCATLPTSARSFNGSTATFTDAASPGGTISDFSATITWGDGSTSDGTLSGPDGGPYTVSGSHTYATTGYFTISTTITDVGGSTTSTSCTTLVYAFAPGGGYFVIGNNNAALGTSTTFWGAQWRKLNSLSGGPAPASFEGYAESPTTPAYGTSWSTDTGNSTPPPAGPLPAYMGVIATSAATQSGSTISGNTVHIVVVKTDPGYQPAVGHPGTGTVVAQVR
jgi:hypothetical protein